MLIGILSDSHGDADATGRAVALLESCGAEALFHCGDICGEGVLDELVGRRAYFVWGNCDEPTASLRKYVESIGLPWPQPPVRVALDGRRIALHHGHESEFHAALHDPDLDYVFFGHTHRVADSRNGGPRAINPGALYRAAVRTVALLDLVSDRLTFLTLDGKVHR